MHKQYFIQKQSQIRPFWLVLTGLIFILKPAQSQDLAFSQFYLAPTYLNPALTGLTDQPRFNLNYRYQYPSFGVAYKSVLFGVDKGWDDYHSGLGLRVALDDAGAGILKNTSLSMTYAYQLRLTSGFKLHLGLDFTFAQLKLDQSKLIFGDQLDPAVGVLLNGGQPISTSDLIDRDQRSYFSSGMGVMVQGLYYFAGLAMHNLNSPDVSFLKKIENGDLPVRISAQGGLFIPLKNLGITSHASLNPVFYYTKQKQASQWTSGMILHSDVIQLGILYRQAVRSADALIFTLGMEREMVRIAYSYDYTVSALSGQTGGTHELGILINLDKVEGYQKEPKFNDCFSIFR